MTLIEQNIDLAINSRIIRSRINNKSVYTKRGS